MPEFDLAVLRRRPDTEAPNLFAVDASDRLILDLSADALGSAARGQVSIIGDQYGALTLGAVALHGARGLRVFQDPLSGELALAENARAAGFASAYSNEELGPELLSGATVVLMRLPRSLSELEELLAAIAIHADPGVVLYAGAMVKHMTMTMNEAFGRYFGRFDVSHARQKARVLIASKPLPAAGIPAVSAEFHPDFGIWVHASGSVFAGSRIDIGTRALLSVIDQAKPDASTAIDLGCGTGVLAATLAARRPGLRVVASDQSASAVASARATMAANQLDDRVTVVRDDALGVQPSASADLIVLNPPFHTGGTVHTGVASRLFAAAARVLRPGGQLWTVYNSHLGYRAELSRLIGPTREVIRTAKFAVTVSTRNEE